MEEYLKTVDLLTVEERYKLEKEIAQLTQQNKEENYIIRGQLLEREEQMKILTDRVNSMQSMMEKLVIGLEGITTLKTAYNEGYQKNLR